MLLKDFYQIGNFTQLEESKYSISIELNEKHEIFEGHFPGNPVMPGVCMIQIIKEMSERIIGQDLFMNQVSMIKFMALVNPMVNPLLRFDIDIQKTDARAIKVKNNVYMEETLAMKFSATYTINN